MKVHKKKSKKGERREIEEGKGQLETDEPNFFTHTFRISKITDMIYLKKMACEFWGLNDKNFTFFNDSGSPLIVSDLQRGKGKDKGRDE